MILHNKQLLMLGLGSILLFSIGFYNKTSRQTPEDIFPKIEQAYQKSKVENKNFEGVLIHDPKTKEITIFHDKEKLGYGEKIGKLMHLKPLAPYLFKLSNKDISKINFRVQDCKIKLFLQQSSSSQTFNWQIKCDPKSSIIDILKQSLETFKIY